MTNSRRDKTLGRLTATESSAYACPAFSLVIRCIRLRDHYGNGRLSLGPVSETDRPHRALLCINMFGVVVIGIQIRGLSSCSGGTNPKAPGRSNNASVERAPRRRDRPARTNSGRDRENVGAPPRRNYRPLKRNPRPIIRGLHQRAYVRTASSESEALAPVHRIVQTRRKRGPRPRPAEAAARTQFSRSGSVEQPWTRPRRYILPPTTARHPALNREP
jgi:hypothetical protein